MTTAHRLLVAAAAPIDRDGARDAAHRELGKRIYARPQRGVLQRVIVWFFDRLSRVFARAAGVAPGGALGIALLVLLVVGLGILLWLRLGRPRRVDVLTDERQSAPRTSADYRAEAEALAGRGEWREAVRARFRAVIRELEQRGAVDQRPGRTAGEIANEASAAMPGIAGSIRRAADVFNEVWYGERAATRAAYDVMVEADQQARSGRPASAVATR